MFIMSSKEQPSNLSNEELEKNIKRKKTQEEEFGPIRPKKETKEDKEKLIEEIRKSIGL